MTATKGDRFMQKIDAAFAVLLVVGLGACGGGSSSPSAPSATPVPTPTRTLVGQGQFQLTDSASAIRQLGTPDLAVQVFTLGAAGTVDVSVDWTFRSNDIDIAILRGSCNLNQLAAGLCNTTPLVQSLSTTAKPETLSARLDAGDYTLVILSNVGNSQESGNFQVFVTR